jgi:hypothetical protein
MEFDKIKELIEKQEIGAITIDTSVFEAQGLKLESGLIKQLEQFSEGPTKVILSEIVKNELFVHLEKKAENIHADIEKALRNAKNHWQLEDNTIDSIKSSIFQDKKPTLIASERLEKFVEITSLEIVKAQDHVVVSQLLEKYFQAKPPFAETGEKKNEFPDAIALMSLEAWAQKNTTKVLVISKDKDWEQYCNNCKNLIFINDLSNAFELFQLQIKPYDICKQLSQKYAKGQLGFVINEIDSALNNGIYNFNIYVEADSTYQYEDEITDINYKKFEFKTIKEPNIIFRPIKFETDTLVVEAALSIDVSIECSFYFMLWDSIDKDYVGMGVNNASKAVTLDVNILVTFIDLSCDFDEDLEVDEVEITTTKKTIDFGYIEPDWMSDKNDY